MTNPTHQQNFLIFRTLLRLVLVVGLMTAAPLLEAGSILGSVYDSRNALYPEGVEVAIVGSGRRVYTEGAGRFSIGGLEPGAYTLTIRGAGYPPVIRTVEIAEPGSVADLMIDLSGESEVFELEAFEVIGAVSATVKALNIERASADLREVVASDIFGQFVDRNPAEALQRVAGVTVEDDQGEGAFVIIRGASPDLSNVQLDGIEVATPQPDGRRVNLNIITVDQLERIEVSKTWLPSQKGNTIGGTVNLVTRSALDRGKRFASAEFAYTDYSIGEEGSYRSQFTFGDTIDSTDWAWLGEDQAIGLQFSASYSEDNRGSETLSFGWELEASYPFGGEPLYGYTLDDNRWRDYEILRERTAVSGKIEVRLSKNHELYLSGSFNRFDDNETQQFFRRSVSTGNDFQWDGDEFLTEANALELGYDLNSSEIQRRLEAPTTSTTRRLTFDESIALGQLVYDEALHQFVFGSWTGGFSRNFDSQLTNDELLNYQFGGQHKFHNDFDVEWKFYSSDAQRETERLEFAFDGPGGIMNTVSGIPLPRIDPEDFFEVSLNSSQYDLSEPASSNSNPNTLYEESFSLSEDERTGFAIDLSKAFEFLGISWRTQLGISYDQREKIFSQDFNTVQVETGAFDDVMYQNNRLRLSDEPFYGGESDSFIDNFGDFFQFGPRFSVDGLRQFIDDPSAFGVTVSDEVSANILSSQFFDRLISNYASTEDILGFYWQQSLQKGPWSLIFGFRWEETENSFTNLSILTRDPETGQFIRPSFWRFFEEDQYSEIITSTRKYDNFMPAIHLRRDIGENWVVRGSVSQTIARPRFDQIDAREIPSLAGSSFANAVRLSNFDSIRPMESVNYDLSIERYFKPVGKVEVAVFYKDLDGPIYTERRISVGPDDETRLYAWLYDSRNGNRDGVDDPTLINSSPWTFSRVTNAGKAELYGYELSFSRRLDDLLPEALRGFTVEGNYAAFESEVQLLAEERIRPVSRTGEVVEVDPTVPLFRQPDHTANLSLIFERWGIFARVSYNLRGKYLNSLFVGDDVGALLRFEDSPAALDEYIDETERWDLTLRYNATDWLQIFLEVINFTNESQVSYLGTTDRPNSMRYTDPIYTVGIKVAL